MVIEFRLWNKIEKEYWNWDKILKYSDIAFFLVEPVIFDVEQYLPFPIKGGGKLYVGDIVNTFSLSVMDDEIYKENLVIDKLDNFELMLFLSKCETIEVVGNVHFSKTDV